MASVQENNTRTQQKTTRSLSTETPSPPVRIQDKRSMSIPGPRRPMKKITFLPKPAAPPHLPVVEGCPAPVHKVAVSPSRIAELKQRELKIRKDTGKIVLNGTVYPARREDMEDIVRIGQGICGEVYRMKHKPSGVKLASKKMLWQHESPEEQRRVLMDLEVMTSHHSPLIVEYYGSAIINNEVWVYMELMLTCLDRLLKKTGEGFPEKIVCKMTVSIVRALHYLKQQHQVIHRDVKPSNILVDTSGNVKLCDFGISGRLVDSKAFTRGAGCAAYMAPERISIAQAPDGYDVRADVWSLGITLVELATGSSPYSSQNFNNEFELLTFIVHSEPPLLDKSKFSEDFRNFVSTCLCKDVGSRPHYAELLKLSLITHYSQQPVDIAAWISAVCSTHGPP